MARCRDAILDELKRWVINAEMRRVGQKYETDSDFLIQQGYLRCVIELNEFIMSLEQFLRAGCDRTIPLHDEPVTELQVGDGETVVGLSPGNQLDYSGPEMPTTFELLVGENAA